VTAENGIDTWPTGRLLSMAARAVEHAWYARLEEVGLSHAGLVVLDLLAAGPKSQVDLAAGSRVQVQTMSRTLARLERDGLVERVRDGSDARRRLVSRTDGGARAWDAARTLETELFPSGIDDAALRGHLLAIMGSMSREGVDRG
jgi:DNA-binding MarR family transcriptional regulator